MGERIVIELVSAARCTGCGWCVKVCPTDVFDGAVGDIPVIARQSDCQTCSLCELYCPADALFVAPVTTPVDADSPWRDEDALAAAGLLGRYRRLEGWGPGRIPSSQRGGSLFGDRMRGAGQPPDPRPDRAGVDTSVLPLDGSLAVDQTEPVSGSADLPPR